MSQKYNIHPDFAKFPVITFKFNAFIMGLINIFMTLQRWLTKRSFALDIENTQLSAQTAAISRSL